jgi:hypothetical protein
LRFPSYLQRLCRHLCRSFGSKFDGRHFATSSAFYKQNSSLLSRESEPISHAYTPLTFSRALRPSDPSSELELNSGDQWCCVGSDVVYMGNTTRGWVRVKHSYL